MSKVKPSDLSSEYKKARQNLRSEASEQEATILVSRPGRRGLFQQGRLVRLVNGNEGESLVMNNTPYMLGNKRTAHFKLQIQGQPFEVSFRYEAPGNWKINVDEGPIACTLRGHPFMGSTMLNHGDVIEIGDQTFRFFREEGQVGDRSALLRRKGLIFSGIGAAFLALLGLFIWITPGETAHEAQAVQQEPVEPTQEALPEERDENRENAAKDYRQALAGFFARGEMANFTDSLWLAELESHRFVKEVAATRVEFESIWKKAQSDFKQKRVEDSLKSTALAYTLGVKLFGEHSGVFEQKIRNLRANALYLGGILNLSQGHSCDALQAFRQALGAQPKSKKAQAQFTKLSQTNPCL